MSTRKLVFILSLISFVGGVGCGKQSTSNSGQVGSTGAQGVYTDPNDPFNVNNTTPTPTPAPTPTPTPTNPLLTYGGSSNSVKGKITSLVNKDRVFGTVSLAAQAAFQGGLGGSSTSETVTLVGYFLDGVWIDNSATSPTETFDWDTNQATNGSHNLRMDAITRDSSGNLKLYQNVATLTLYVRNNAETETKAAGGTAGPTPLTDLGSTSYPAGANLYGLKVKFNPYGGLRSFQAEWTNAYGPATSKLGPKFLDGDAYTNDESLRCPDPRARVSGVQGYHDGNWLDRIGLICKLPESNTRLVTNIVGGISANFFSVECPANTLVVGIRLNTDPYFGSIQLICQ